MKGKRATPGNHITRLAVALSLLLSLTGLLERWSGPDIPFRIRRHKVVLRSAVGDEAGSAFMAGDSLLSIASAPLLSDASAMGRLVDIARDGPVPVEYIHLGRTQVTELSFPPPGPSRRVSIALRGGATIFIFLIGLWVSLRRRDAVSRHFLYLTLLTGSLLSHDPRTSLAPWAQLLEWKTDLVSLFLPAVFLYFITLFPERRPHSRWLRVLIFLPPSLLGLLTTCAMLGLLPPDEDGVILTALTQSAGILALLLLVATLSLVAYKAIRRKYERERHRMRLVLLSAFFSLLPLAIFQILHQVLPGRHLYLSAWTPLFLVFLPLSFAYGILGTDLPALQKRSSSILRLAFSGSLLILLFLFFRFLIYLVWGHSAQVGDDILADIFALGSSLFFMPLLRRRLLLQWTDHNEGRFQGCCELLAPPHYFDSKRELRSSLLPLLGRESKAAWLFWLEMVDGGTWRRCASWHEESASDDEIAGFDEEGISLPQGLDEALLTGRMLAVEQWDPYWARKLIGPHALTFCKSRDWSLLLPILGESERPILLVFGPSVDSALFSRAVTRGLEQMQATLDLHLRNLSLLVQITHEKQLRAELDVARNIQQSLISSRTPDLPDVELAGRMVTSSEVGGDYFGFLELPDEQLGLALGDATGHGVPAALLISTVAMVFHNQAKQGKSPEQVLGGMNSDLMSLPAKVGGTGVFAGFVYALYERNSSTLFYCNGGMPPPFLLRKDGSVERLSRGGLLLGLTEEGQYFRGLLRLQPGDLLIMRSDGIEDQCNPDGEAFGDARLLAWLVKKGAMPLDQMADELVTNLRSFTTSDFTDDISFILMRLRDIPR